MQKRRVPSGSWVHAWGTAALLKLCRLAIKKVPAGFNTRCACASAAQVGDVNQRQATARSTLASGQAQGLTRLNAVVALGIALPRAVAQFRGRVAADSADALGGQHPAIRPSPQPMSTASV